MNPGKILSNYPPDTENMLNILHDLQDASDGNYLTQEVLRAVAEYLNTPLATVYGVVKYYSMFSTVPRGRYIIRLCQSPICHMMGSETVLDTLKEILGVELNEVTGDGLFSLELSECLGICDVAPSMMIGDEIYGPLTPGSLEAIISDFRQKECRKG